MRILYVTAGIELPGSHGGSVHTREVARGLARRGHEVHVAALPGHEDADLPADWLGGAVLHRLSRPLPVSQLEWMAWRQIRRIAESVAPEVIIERFHAFGGGGMLAARRLGVPVLSEVHTPAYPFPGSWRDRLDALTLVRPIDRWRRVRHRWAAAFYGQAAITVPPEYRDRYVEVVSGADAERFRPGPPAADDGPLRGVYLSSFRAWHGAEDLVEALALCAACGVDVEVAFLGDGPRRAAAERAAARHGLGKRVRFLGAVAHDRVPEHMATADVGLAPFNLEAHAALRVGWYWSPLKLFEFLAAGLPVVTIDVKYLREHLTDDTARFYPSGDIEALAAAIEGLAADRAAVRAMGERARLLATTEYSWERQVELIERLLQSVLEENWPSGGA